MIAQRDYDLPILDWMLPSILYRVTEWSVSVAAVPCFEQNCPSTADGCAADVSSGIGQESYFWVGATQLRE